MLEWIWVGGPALGLRSCDNIADASPIRFQAEVLNLSQEHKVVVPLIRNIDFTPIR
jgi:hypothetical protein